MAAGPLIRLDGRQADAGADRVAVTVIIAILRPESFARREVAGAGQLPGLERAARTVTPWTTHTLAAAAHKSAGSASGAITAPEDAHVIMDRAIEAGVNFWDTSRIANDTRYPQVTMPNGGLRGTLA